MGICGTDGDLVGVGGYTCWNCGVYVPCGTYHSCVGTAAPQHTNPDMGWTCPKCGRVYSPSVEECWRCNDDV